MDDAPLTAIQFTVRRGKEFCVNYGKSDVLLVNVPCRHRTNCRIRCWDYFEQCLRKEHEMPASKQHSAVTCPGFEAGIFRIKTTIQTSSRITHASSWTQNLLRASHTTLIQIYEFIFSKPHVRSNMELITSSRYCHFYTRYIIMTIWPSISYTQCVSLQRPRILKHKTLNYITKISLQCEIH